MAKDKPDWDSIPSLEGLSVDWQYEPENPLGKRAWLRIVDRELLEILGVTRIPLKVAARGFEESGLLLDVGQGGCSALLKSALSEGQAVKVGFFLGREKVISKAIVRNVAPLEGSHRTGLAFVDLDKASREYIVGLASAKGLQRTL